MYIPQHVNDMLRMFATQWCCSLLAKQQGMSYVEALMDQSTRRH